MYDACLFASYPDKALAWELFNIIMTDPIAGELTVLIVF